MILKSIAKGEDQIENIVAKEIEKNIQAVHQRLDVFQVWLLANPTPTIAFTTLQEVVECLRADVENI